jgi:hypothetical protein
MLRGRATRRGSVMQLRVLSRTQADAYLKEVGTTLGDWNEVLPIRALERNQTHFPYRSPQNGLELFNFAQHVAGWIPKGHWKLVQFDNSTSLSTDEAYFLVSGLNKGEEAIDVEQCRSFLFEFTDEWELNTAKELTIANVLFLVLMFQCHGYVISSSSRTGRYIAFQDGFVYFYGEESDTEEAALMVRSLAREPLKNAQWVQDIYQRREFTA